MINITYLYKDFMVYISTDIVSAIGFVKKKKTLIIYNMLHPNIFGL